MTTNGPVDLTAEQLNDLAEVLLDVDERLEREERAKEVMREVEDSAT